MIQKVYFKAKAPDLDDVYYESTVRSCSVGHCQNRDDFHNCSTTLLENPGCMKRFCCDKWDLCNSTFFSTPDKCQLLVMVIGVLVLKLKLAYN